MAVQSAMRPGNNHNRSFILRLSLTFAGSGLILLLAGGFALYLMGQLGTAVERAISEILPKTLVAMRLSEHSALLAASAPSLTAARNSQETHQVAVSLDTLKIEIDNNVSFLEKTAEPPRLAQIRNNVEILANTLLTLKSATNHRIALDERRFRALTRIREVHSEFADTVSPVVWGVSSLTRLFGQRAARANIATLKALRDQHVHTLTVLLELGLAYRDLMKSDISNAHASNKRDWSAFNAAWKRTLTLLDTPRSEEDPDIRPLVESGERFLSRRQFYKRSLNNRPDPQFEATLSRAVDSAKEALAQRFSTALQLTRTRISELIEQSVKDMGYALDIKAEGNLLFTLLTAVADASSRDNVSSLQDRFKRSHATFAVSAKEFLGSRLSQRNPILAGNVKDIERRLHALGYGPENLFDVRRKQLAAFDQIEQLLATNRNIAEKLNEQVERLVAAVQDQAASISSQLELSRGVNRALLILVFIIGLIMLSILAVFSIRTFGKQERDIRQAATVFESTGEGIIITNPKLSIIAVNEAFLNSFAYKREELIGRHIRVLRSKHHHKVFYKEILETLAQTGCWQGEIYTRERSGDSRPEWLTVNAVKNNRGNLNQYVAVFSDVAIIRRSLQQLDHLAHHDTLTGLPNRLLLQDRLSHAIFRAHRDKRQLAILFLDLDRFKNINDTLGHTFGDHLLRIFAERLSSLIRQGDTVARLGGDEFMILLEDYRFPEDAHVVAKKILSSLDEAFNIHEQELFVTASIGICLYPDDGITVDKLIRNSDTAMYQAKDKGRNNYQFYTSELTAIARANLLLESSLRLALDRNEFLLYYQPKWNTTTGEITGVEALLRWQHPERGLIGPAEFLTTLEECGLILPIGKWLLRTACRQAQEWRQQGLPAIQMSINLSGHQIVEGTLLQEIVDTLNESHFDPRHLELELTEGFIMKRPSEVIALLNSLRAMGVSFSIDDFGTGHSSLSYLKQLPVQKLKIDRSFVRDIPFDPDDMAITSAIVALGHRLKMSIVAEGVETEEQLAFLINEGCEEAQGYLFCAPLPESELRSVLQQGYYCATRTSVTKNG